MYIVCIIVHHHTNIANYKCVSMSNSTVLYCM